MKIKNLDKHCGECNLIEYCGNTFGYSICKDERFQELEEEEYLKFAEQAEIEAFEACRNCNELCRDCDIEEEAREYEVRQMADFVEKELENEY